MKKLLLIAFVFVALCACTGNTGTSVSNSSNDTTAVDSTADTVVVDSIAK